MPVAQVVVGGVRVRVLLVDLHDDDPLVVLVLVGHLLAVLALVCADTMVLIVVFVVLCDSNDPVVPVIDRLELTLDVISGLLVVSV